MENKAVKLEQDLIHELEKYNKKFEQHKEELIGIISKAGAAQIVEIEDYVAWTNINKTARYIEEIEAKLRTVRYLTSEE